MRPEFAQKRGWRRAARGVSFLALVPQLLVWLLVAGCAIPYVPFRTIYEDPVNYVRLEEDDAVLPEWPPGHHNHPKIFTVDQFERLLNGMTVQEHRIWIQKWIQGEAPIVPAFKEEEVTLL